MAGKTLVIPNTPSNKNNMHQLKYARTRLREHSPHLQSVPSYLTWVFPDTYKLTHGDTVLNYLRPNACR